MVHPTHVLRPNGSPKHRALAYRSHSPCCSTPSAPFGCPTRRSQIAESSTMDCPISLNGNVYGMHNWPDGLRGQAVFLRKLAKQADDPVVKNELLELASFCEEAADNIEDHLTGGEDHAPRGPLSRLS